MAMDRPARVANAKPVYISLSAKITVSRMPHLRKAALMSLEISFFLSGLLMCGERQAGRQNLGEQRTSRPWCRNAQSFRAFSPSAPTSIFLDSDRYPRAFSSTLPLSYAREASATLMKSEPSPRALIFLAGGVIQAQHDVLGRNNDGLAVRRMQHVV